MRHPSELTWTRHLADDLGLFERWRLDAHLRRCQPCRRREAALATDRAQVELELASGLERLLAEAPVAPGGRRRPPARMWAFAGAFGVAAVVAVSVRLIAPARDELRARGGGRVEYFVDRGARSEPLGPRCAPGDRLIARYRADGYLLVLERDGRGNVQVLFPPGGSAAAVVAGAGTTPTSWVLDDVPGDECFVAFFSDRPLEVAAALGALAASPSSPRLTGAKVQVQCCVKEVPR